MEIKDSISSVSGSTKGESRTRTNQQSSGVSHSSAPATDKVDLSSLSSALQNEIQQASTEAPIDVSRVAELKELISQGQVPFHSEKIADGLIKSVREFLNSQAAPSA